MSQAAFVFFILEFFLGGYSGLGIPRLLEDTHDQKLLEAKEYEDRFKSIMF